MTEAINRDAKGRFGAGNNANPAGRPRASMEQRLERLLERHGTNTLERAFQVAQYDDTVLASLLGFLAATLNADNLQSLALANAGTGTAH